MSPWWREQVLLFLAPDRLVAVRLSRGPRRRALAGHVETCEASASDAAPMLARLADLLRQPQWGRADAIVLLSSRFATYQLLPWTEAVLDADEAAARTRQLLARARGESAAALELRTSSGGFGHASLASGVEQRLLAAVREACAAASLRVVSIQPYLMAAFNACRRALPRGPHWFVVAESGTLCTALIQGGRWLSLRSRRVADAWAEELVPTLRRQALVQDEAGEVSEVVIHAADGAGAQLPAHVGWTVRELLLGLPPGLAAGDARALGPALVGVA